MFISYKCHVLAMFLPDKLQLPKFGTRCELKIFVKFESSCALSLKLW